MFSNNNHNSSCAFAEQIVSYIYDEASAKEKTEFESHLPNCLNCADEIAGFGFVRSSINEWRKDEFFTLESPALEIPALRPANLAQTTVVSNEKDSWIDELRKLFSFSPAWAVGFGALIISIGLVWMFFGSSQNDLADKSSEIPSVAPVIENKTVSNPKEEITQNSQVEKVAETPKAVENKHTAQKNQVVKASNNTPKLKSVTPKKNETVAGNKPNKKSNNVQKQEVPTLSNLKEEEDKSLRLAELFDEIDTK